MKVYNDTFVEELIRRERPGGELVFKIVTIVLALALVGLAYWFLTSIFPFCFALVCILVFFAFHYTVKEFEYSFINGDIDIDGIWGKRKRKAVFSTNTRQIKVFAPYTGKAPEGNFTTTLDASISPRAPGRWYFITERDDGTQALVYLNPSERMLNAFRNYLGNKMRGALPQ